MLLLLACCRSARALEVQGGGGGGGGGGSITGGSCPANQYAESIAAAGVPTCAQVGFSQLSGSASTSQIPAGGSCTAGQYATAIAAGLTPTCAVVNFSQLGGTGTNSQLAGPLVSSLAVPAEFSVSNPSGVGAAAITKANENANTIFAGPSSGVAAAPGFRALVAADIPAGGACTAGQYATAIAAGLTPTCAVVNFSQLGGSLAYSQMPASGVTAGSYTNANLTVNAQGVVTAASNGSGGASGANGLSANGLQGSGSVNVSAIGTPGAPAVTVNGTAGTSSYSYYCVATDYNGNQTMPSAATAISNGAATPNNTVSCGGQTGAVGYIVVKTNTSTELGLCTTTSGTACSVTDTGQATSAYTPQSADQTGTVSAPAMLTQGLTVNPAGLPVSGTQDVGAVQGANGNSTFVCRRNTDTSPSGMCFEAQSAAGTDLASVDVNGNAVFNNVTINGTCTGAGCGGGSITGAAGQGVFINSSDTAAAFTITGDVATANTASSPAVYSNVINTPTTVQLNAPSGAVGSCDLAMLINYSTATHATVTAVPSGWTQLNSVVTANGYSIQYTYYHTVASGDPTSWTWTTSNSAVNWYGETVNVANASCNAIDKNTTGAVNAGGTSLSLGAVTPAVIDELVVVLSWTNVNTVTGGPTFAAFSGGSSTLWSATQPSGSAIGPLTVNFSASNSYGFTASEVTFEPSGIAPGELDVVGLHLTSNVITATSYTVASTDSFIAFNGTAAATITLPAATASGRVLLIKNLTTSTVTVSRAGTDTIDGGTSVSISSQYGVERLVDYASGKWGVM